MGSIHKNGNPSPPKLPTIKLDTTLIDLYKLASPSSHANLKLGMVFGVLTNGIDLTPNCPRNTKYLYQDSSFITVPRDQLTTHNPTLRKALTVRYLNLIPQRDAFISGQTPTIMFYRGQTESQKQHDRRQTEETFSVLDTSQHPEVIFCRGPSELHIPIKQHNIQRLTYKMISDVMASQYDKYLLHDPETQWYLNTKAALATSGLPTPKTEILKLDPPNPPSPNNCCPSCVASFQTTIKSSQIPSITPECTGPRRKWLILQLETILKAIKAREIPFVVKTQQTFGGAGTWVITTQEQKDKLLEHLYHPDDEENSLLCKLLPQTTLENSHLHPAAILISEYVGDPVNNFGITFVVTTQGNTEGKARAVFLAASEQMIEPDSGAWLGSTIDYANQSYLQNKFQGLIDQTAEWIVNTNTSGFQGQNGSKKGAGEKGYFGPVGIDVLETLVPSSASQVEKTPNGYSRVEKENGKVSKFDVVDVNARTSGSLALPLLKTHFTSRGLNVASSLAVQFRGGRKEFLQRWRGEFEEGRMLILSWYEDYGDDEEVVEEEVEEEEEGDRVSGIVEGNGDEERERGVVWSFGDVVVGGEGRGELMALLDRVRECIEEVTF